jgi:hypothetical protein
LLVREVVVVVVEVVAVGIGKVGRSLWRFKERIKEKEELALENGRRFDSHAVTIVYIEWR